MSQENTGQAPDANGKEAGAFRERLVAFLEEHGLKTSHPVVEIRIADVTTWWRVVLDLQTVIWSAGAAASEKDQDGEQRPPAGWKPDPAIEAMAKAWERLRKAIGEIEGMCGQAEQPARMGLGSRMKPLIEQTRGVLEDAIEFQRKKEERAARKLKARESQSVSKQGPKAADTSVPDAGE